MIPWPEKIETEYQSWIRMQRVVSSNRLQVLREIPLDLC